MPAPIPFNVRPATTRPAAAPPPPPPGFFETVGAGFRTAKDDIGFVQRERLDEAYRPIVEALEERGQGGQWWFTNPAAVLLPFQDRLDHDRIWSAIERQRERDPGAFADLPRTREEFEQGVLTRQGARAGDLQTVARGSTAAALAGGIGAMVFDPVNVGTAPIGGSARTIGQAVLREAVINATIEAVQQVPLARARERMGETLTGEEALLNVGAAGIFGGLLGGLTKGAVDNWDAVKAAPKAVQEKAWAAVLERVPALRDRIGSTVDWDALDGHLPDLAEGLIGRDSLSEAELGFVDSLRREGQVEAASPFIPNGAAAELHPRLLGEAMRRVLDDLPPAAPLVEGPRRASALGDSTAIASRTVQPGDAAPGAQVAFMQRVRRAESAGDDAARNPRSSATGRYQFTDGTWLAYYKRRFGSGGLSDAQILAKRTDGELQDTLMRDLTADNAAFLRNRGEAVSEGNLYLVHFAGQGGARKLFDADPTAPVEAVLGAAVVRANPHLAGMNAGEVIAWAHRTMGQPPSRRAGARAEVDEVVSEEGFRTQLQEEIDAITARLDALASERGVGDDSATNILENIPDGPQVAAGGRADMDALPEPIDAPELRARDPDLPDLPPFMPALRSIESDRTRSLNDIDGLAAELGASAEEVRRGLQGLVAEGRLTMNRKTGMFMRKPPKADENELLEFIAKAGGLRDDEGHGLGLRGISGRERREMVTSARADALRKRSGGRRDWQRMTRSHGPLLRHEGRSVDEIGELLWEAGWFTERPTVDQVLQLIERRMASKEPMFPPGYEPGGRAAPDPVDDGIDPGELAARESLRTAWADAGHDPAELAALAGEDGWFLTHFYLLWEKRGYPDPATLTIEAAESYGDDLLLRIAEALNDPFYIPFDTAVDERIFAARRAAGQGGEGLAAFLDDAGPGEGGSRAAARAAERAYDDGQRLAALAPEERAPFADPESAPAKAQADSLQHDAIAAYHAEFDSPRTSEEAADLIGPPKDDPERAPWEAGWLAGRNGAPEPEADNPFHDGWFSGNATFQRRGALDAVSVHGGMDEDAMFASLRALPDDEASEDLLASLRSRIWSEAEAAGTLHELDSPVARFDAARERWEEQFGEARERAAVDRRAQQIEADRQTAERVVAAVEAGAEFVTINHVRKQAIRRGAGHVRVGPGGNLQVLEGRSWVAIPGGDELANIARQVGITPPAAPRALDLGEAVDPNVAALDRQRAQLGAEAPLRAPTEQESTLGFGLFGAADGVRLDPDGEARPLRDLLDELDAEAAEIKAIRDCL